MEVKKLTKEEKSESLTLDFYKQGQSSQEIFSYHV